MKQLLSMLCFIAIVLTSQAQDKNFDLSKYKFPDYKRHEMELYFNSSGHGESYNAEYFNSGSSTPSRFDRTRFNMSSYLDLMYNFKNHTRKYITNHSLTFSGNFSYSKNGDFDEKTTESKPHTSIGASGFKRNYLTEDKYFIEGIYNSSFDASTHKYTSSNSEAEDVSKNNSFRVSAGVGAGVGRIEQVGDLFQGYYILQKLNKHKTLNRDLADKDIFEFATLISQLKNKRFFDFRLRKIAELHALDSLLNKQGLVQDNTITYFTTLNDYWSFGNFWERKSGREIKLVVLPEFSGSHYRSGTYSNSPLKTDLVSMIQFDCSKQLNLFWERNIHIDLSNTTLLTKNNDVGKNFPQNLFRTRASYGFGFFPNSRTKLTSSVRYQGGESANYENSAYIKSWTNSVSMLLEANYYISPQLQLTGNFSGNYWASKHNSVEGHDFSYNLGLRYAIF